MQGRTVRIVSQAIQYIEHNLNGKLDLDIVAAALHYMNSGKISDIYQNEVQKTAYEIGW